ncbi:hypothetical protein IWZ00DRAFT_372123 [Phyllosticta capitalensis]|uniref:Secreted protein n=1 Tax=Phyllosticta capitalensis TaxID=121624 RepID=A0ABR1YE21_9PEZI
METIWMVPVWALAHWDILAHILTSCDARACTGKSTTDDQNELADKMHEFPSSADISTCGNSRTASMLASQCRCSHAVGLMSSV